jgi:hypothetical protein
MWVNSHNRYAYLSISRKELYYVLTSIMPCTAMRARAFWLTMNLFRWPGVSLNNTAIIHSYRNVSFQTFKILWNQYFIDYLLETWSHCQHLVDSSITLASKHLTLPNVYAFIHSRLLSALMAAEQLVWSVTPRQLMNAPKACGMPCAMHGLWFLNAGHLILQESRVDCSSPVIEYF